MNLFTFPQSVFSQVPWQKTASKYAVLWLKIMLSDLTSAITQHSPVINGRWISVTEKSNPSVTESSLILNYNDLHASSKALFYIYNASTSEAKTQAQTIARHVIRTKAPITVSSRLLWRTAFDIEKIFFILMQRKSFHKKVVHLASFWKWGFLELGSGQLAT